MGIGIRNLSAGSEAAAEAADYAAALRQTAAGILGTTVQMADLVRRPLGAQSLFLLLLLSHRRHGADGVHAGLQVIPFVAGGFMYIGAVAVLPTYVFSFRCAR